MELELSLKITKVRDDDDLASVTDFRFAKDSAGPLFFSTENDTKFILTAHLKGFRREKIKIEINEDGTRITIKGEKQVEEMVMVGWKILKKGAEIRPFKRVFRIPDGVILDRIKAKFNEDKSILTINMPKSIKGLLGVEIEEVNEEELEIPKQDSSIRMIYKQKESKEEKAEAFKIEQGKEEIEEMSSKKKEELAPTTMERDPEIAIDEGKEIEAERAGGQSEKTEQPVPSPEKTRVGRLPDLTENAKKEKIAEAESKKPEEKGSEEQHRSPDKEIQQSESPNKTSIQQSKVEEEQSTKVQIHQTEREMPPQEHQKEVEQPTKTEPPPTEKPLVEELPAGSKEEAKKDEIPEAESEKPKGVSEETAEDQTINPQPELPNETSSTQQSKFEEEDNKGESPQEESKMPQEESSKHETNSDIQEPMKSESDQEREPTATPHLDNPAAQENRIEEASHEAENETEKATADQVKLAKEKEVHEQESLKVEKKKGPSDQAAIQPKQPRSKLFFAGSAFLVSIIVLVIHLIRGKKG